MATERDDEEETSSLGDDEPASTVVDIESDDDGEEEPVVANGQSRADKKKERGKLREEHGRMTEEHGRMTKENSDLKERLARLEGVVQAGMQQTRRDADRAESVDDPSAGELDGIYEEQSALALQIEQLGTKMTDTQAAAFKKKYQQLERRKVEIITESHMAKRPAGERQDPHARIRDALQVNYSDVYQNDRAREWAKGRYHTLVADPISPRPEGPETVKEALEDARVKFNLSRPPVNGSDRAKFSGTGRGGGGGGQQGPITKVTMTEGQKKLANVAYAHIKDEATRHKLWASKAGKRMAEKQRAKMGR